MSGQEKYKITLNPDKKEITIKEIAVLEQNIQELKPISHQQLASSDTTKTTNHLHSIRNKLTQAAETVKNDKVKNIINSLISQSQNNIENILNTLNRESYNQQHNNDRQILKEIFIEILLCIEKDNFANDEENYNKAEVVIPYSEVDKALQKIGAVSKKKNNALLTSSLIILAVFALSATIMKLITSWIAMKLAIPLTISALLIVSLGMAVIKACNPETPKANHITNDETNLLKIKEENWWNNSVAGKIADYIGKNPIFFTTLILIGLTVLSIASLSSIGVTLITRASILFGMTFYGTLYSIIITTAITFTALLSAATTVLTTIKNVSSAILAKKSLQQKENNEKTKYVPFKLNPISKMWETINNFLDSFYAYGAKNPVAMLSFTIVYFLILFDITKQFLPNIIHKTLLYFAAGLVNTSTGMLLPAICTAWFAGLLVLTIADIISKGEDSNTAKTIMHIKNNAIDATLFLLFLIFSAKMIDGTELAHICGKWKDLSLLTVNIKPLVALGDFFQDPQESILISAVAVILLPVNILLFPGHFIIFVCKQIIKIIGETIKHLLHAIYVLAEALINLLGIAIISVESQQQLSSYSYQTHRLIHNTMHNTTILYKEASKIYIHISLIAHIVLILGSIIAIYSSINIAMLVTPLVPQTTIITNYLATLLGLPAAKTIVITLSCYCLVLSMLQLYNNAKQSGPIKLTNLHATQANSCQIMLVIILVASIAIGTISNPIVYGAALLGCISIFVIALPCTINQAIFSAPLKMTNCSLGKDHLAKCNSTYNGIVDDKYSEDKVDRSLTA